MDILPGIPGVETLLPLIYTQGVAQGRIELPRLVQILAENPAKIYGLWPRKAAGPGSDADLVVYNPEPRWQLDDTRFTPWPATPVLPVCGFRAGGAHHVARPEPGSGRKILGRRGQGQFVPAGWHVM